jgi:periplasmic protein TonB
MASYQRISFDPKLPWEKNSEEINRFLVILAACLAFAILVTSVFPYLTVPKLDRAKATTIPPRLVKMVLEQKKKIVEPPPPAPEPEKEKEKEPEKEPEKIAEEKPVEKETAKEVAKKHIAVFDALADLRDLDDIDDLKNNQSLSNDTGKAAVVTRSLITKKATQGSGGIRVASASRSSGVGALRGQNVTKVTSDIGSAVENTKRKTKNGHLKRSDENIQLTFEKSKPAIFALYHRALRKNPALQGRVVFKLTIAASGKVIKCGIDSSELDDPALLKRLVAKIKRINFGAQNVGVWKDTYLINFLPS